MMKFGSLFTGIEQTTKRCTRCGEEKPLESFHRQKRGRLGRHSWCKVCFNRWHPDHRPPELSSVKREKNLKSRYSLSVADVLKMVAGQGGKCKICGSELGDKYKIDHDHNTKRVRGILCHRCNLMIAGIEQDGFLQKALLYLGITNVDSR